MGITVSSRISLQILDAGRGRRFHIWAIICITVGGYVYAEYDASLTAKGLATSCSAAFCYLEQRSDNFRHLEQLLILGAT